MPDLYSIASLLAVLVLAAFIWAVGRHGEIAKPEISASVRIHQDLIDFHETEGEAVNHGTAYIASGAKINDIAIALYRGDGWVVRQLSGIAGLDRAGLRLNITMNDFTFPRVQLTFANVERAQLWEARLTSLLCDHEERVPRGPAESR